MRLLSHKMVYKGPETKTNEICLLISIDYKPSIVNPRSVALEMSDLHCHQNFL
jgi:hypothetical protein